MKISLHNNYLPAKPTTILVRDRLRGLARLRVIKSANFVIDRGPLDSLSYRIEAELHFDGEPLKVDAEDDSFRTAFERVLQQLQTLLIRHSPQPKGSIKTS